MKDFVFKEEDGKLKFVGDFDGLYKSDPDPWKQSGRSKDAMAAYYRSSRSRILKAFQERVRSDADVLEVGCGLGYMLRYLSCQFPSAKLCGLDISPIAIASAKNNYPRHQYICGDVCAKEPPIDRQFDVILLNQVLWYILHEFVQAMENCKRYLKKDGLLIFSQAFLASDNQRYGREVINGFEGLVYRMLSQYEADFVLLSADYEDRPRYIHFDGLLVLRYKGSSK